MSVEVSVYARLGNRLIRPGSQTSPSAARQLRTFDDRMICHEYFVSLCCTGVPMAGPAPEGTAVGVDVGIESLMTLSDGTKIQNHKAAERLARKDALRKERRRIRR